MSLIRLYGVFQTDELDGYSTCLAVFDDRSEARAFVRVLDHEQQESIALEKDQQTRPLHFYEEPVKRYANYYWTVQSLAYNPTTTKEIYT